MKQFLANVQGVDGYLIFSMIVFMLFFVGLLGWVFKADKQYINDMKNIPLDHNDMHNEKN
jgi:cytochrome c oxidase cbb3-type subunit 4